MQRHELLVVDDDAEDLDRCRRFLESKGYGVSVANCGLEAVGKVKLAPTRFSIVILDFQMEGMNGADTTRALIGINPDLLILIFSGQEEMGAFLQPFRNGACAFVKKGEGLELFETELKKLCAKYDETCRTIEQSRSESENEKIIREAGMVGCSWKLAEAVRQVNELRDKEDTVTLLGESGTGKEMLARALHREGSGPFLARNCAALHKETADSALFGHKKGSFTGAIADSLGFFRQAKGGTRFLDELHELSPEIQTMVLRAIQERTVMPVGTNEEVPYEARLIVGAKPNVVDEVWRGGFKLDLFTRLNEALIRVPALRERPEDLAPLVEHFCREWSKRFEIEKQFLSSALPLLESFTWPGNVRELRNLVFAVARFTKEKPKVSASDIEEAIASGNAIVFGHPKDVGPVESVRKVADEHILEVLAGATSASDAARKMGVAPSTVTRFLQKKGLNPKSVIGKHRPDIRRPDGA